MSAEQRNVIDYISLDEEQETVVLSIADNLSWDEATDHVLLLQDKLNWYLEFIEGDEIYEKYPQARGKSVTIEVLFKYQPVTEAVLFLEKVNELLVHQYKYNFEYRVI